MKNEIKHTPLPWSRHPAGDTMRGYSQSHSIVEMGKPNLIAGVFKDVKGGEETAKANAEFIVRAVNVHYELIQALEAMVEADDDICHNRGLKSDQTMLRIAAIDMAIAAIAKATE